MTFKNRPYSEPKNPVGSVAELFAGVGGFRVGLARAGWKTVFSNQWEPSTKLQHASDVYIARFGPEGHTNQDIATIKSIPQNFDLLVGGFPCQDYSVAKSANSAMGLEGKKGVLWWEILRLVRRHKPRFVFLENVDRLLKSPTAQRGRDFAVMLTTLSNAGYLVEWRVVNAAEYGFPQRRIRVFIVATRQSSVRRKIEPSNYIFSEGILPQSLPVVPNDSGVHQIDLGHDPVWVSDTFGKQLAKSPFSNAGVCIDGRAFTAKVVAKSRVRQMSLGDVLLDASEVPPQFWVPTEQIAAWKILKAAKAIERTHKESGFTYLYSEGSMSFPDPVDRPSRTILTGEGGTSPSRFKHVIESEGRFRRLVPVELERLSGFPDNWTKPEAIIEVSDNRRAFFIGNALIVGLVELVGETLAKELAKAQIK